MVKELPIAYSEPIAGNLLDLLSQPTLSGDRVWSMTHKCHARQYRLKLFVRQAG